MTSRLPVAGLVVLALILIPFFLWEDALRLWFGRVVTSPGGAVSIAAGLAGLLALDIVLPVPSSLVSTAAGGLLGFWPGVAVSWTGMSLGCAAGYALGRWTPAHRWLTVRDMERLDHAKSRYGDWLVILFRSIPVLAEASVVFAGLSHMPAGRFALLAGLANLGISAVYAAAGAGAAGVGSFLMAFAAAVAVPAVAMALVRRKLPPGSPTAGTPR